MEDGKATDSHLDEDDADDDILSVSLDEIDVCPYGGESGPSEDPFPAEVQSQPVRVKSNSSSSSKSDALRSVEWVEVKRTKRKARFYRIEGSDEDEGFRAVFKAADHTKIPACINGRRPFKVVPGFEYGLEEEVGAGDEIADEKEIKMIKKENYLLDSFVCDIGYLSDDELNETPCRDKVESRVKRLRRANTIKESRKLEELTDPLVSGPYWWKGGGGCKKEVKKWQTIVFSTLPIPTSFSRPVPDYILEVEHETALEPEIAQVEESEGPAVVVTGEGGGGEEYETKYHVKYLIKFLVQERMRGGRAVVSPRDCSTPMVRRPVSNRPAVSKVSLLSITRNIIDHCLQEELLKQVAQYEDNIVNSNPEMVKKYVTKYYNKFSYP